MKTRIKIATMLISILVGSLAANAQSARRGETHKRTTSTSKAYKSSRNTKATSVRSLQSAQKKEAPARSVKRTNPPRNLTARNANRSHVERRTSQRQTVTSRQERKHVSTTTRNNPRSKYRAPKKTVHIGKTHLDPKPSERYVNTAKRHPKRVQRSNNSNYGHAVTHRHYYYPSTKVRIHVHPRTYRNHYRVIYRPAYREIIWTRSMHRHYVSLYPSYSWRYSYGYRIQTMSVWDAKYNVGEIARVYGRVYATWYNRETDDLLLFFGGEYPYQEFTMVIPGRIARRYSWRPERYFLGQHVTATGLITSFEGKAEMVIKRRSQVDVY